MGIALDPNFATNGWVYVYYAPDSANNSDPANFFSRVSRFTVDANNDIDPASEKVIITVPASREPDEPGHTGGNLDFDLQGNLLLGVGDDVNPHSEPSGGYAPLSERADRMWDARQTSANTNDLRGKLLRVKPKADGGYDIPAGNLFAARDASKTRPEIYAMGFRNPWKFSVDPNDGLDRPRRLRAGQLHQRAQHARPGRHRRVQRHQGAGQLRLAAVHGQQRAVPRRRLHDDAGHGRPVLRLRQPGQRLDQEHRPAQPAPGQGAGHVVRLHAVLGPGRDPRRRRPGPDGRPVLQVRRGPRRPTRSSRRPTTARPSTTTGPRTASGPSSSATNGKVEKVNRFMPNTSFLAPQSLSFGPDGSLYALEWGGGFGRDNPNSGIYRIDYINGSRSPVAVGSATPDNGQEPLTVTFSSVGSADPEGGTLTYAWDFNGDGTTDSTVANPTHQYTTPGVYQARLTVTDPAGKDGTTVIVVTVGNTKPTVKFNGPVNGGFVNWGDRVNWDVTVTDAEDTVDYNDLIVQPALGHDAHAHPLLENRGKTGSVVTDLGSGHSEDMKVFFALDARYTDKGDGSVPALTGTDTVILQPKRKEAEHADGPLGTTTVATRVTPTARRRP